MATIGAAMMILPSYVALELLNRLKMAISTVSLLSLAIFLIGAFLLIRVLRD